MTADKGDKFKKIISTLVAATGIAFLSYVTYLAIPSFVAISDLPEYYAPARLIVEGHGTSAYNSAENERAQHQFFAGMQRVVPLYVPPPGLALISPIGVLPKSAITAIWKIFMAASLVGAIVFLRRTVPLTYRQTCYLIAGITFSDACFEALRIDQLAPFLFLAFAGSVFFLKERKEIPAGLMLSILILKPQQILPFAAYLVASRRWKTLGVAALAVALLTLISFVQIGTTGFHDYVEAVRSPLSLQHMQPELTPTFRGQMLRFFPAQAATVFGISAALEVVSILVALFLGWRWRRDSRAILLGVLTVMPLGLVLSMHCHDYDLLLLVPSILLFFMDTTTDFSAIFKLIVMLGGMTFMTGVAVQIHYDYLLKGGVLNVWFWQLLLFAIAILFVAYKKTKVEER